MFPDWLVILRKFISWRFWLRTSEAKVYIPLGRSIVSWLSDCRTMLTSICSSLVGGGWWKSLILNPKASQNGQIWRKQTKACIQLGMEQVDKFEGGLFAVKEMKVGIHIMSQQPGVEKACQTASRPDHSSTGQIHIRSCVCIGDWGQNVRY